MSFGFGVGDFIAVGKLAWSVYKSCKDAPESFSNISAEVLSLHAVLKEVEEALADEPLTESKKRSLTTVGNGCQSVLSDLQALVVKYESLGSQSRRTWDRMRWGSNDIAELRARLTSNTMLLTAFLVTSQVTVERKLNKFVEEFQDGKHEGSVITVATVDSLAADETETWRAIRKELETIGISVVAFDTNRPFIMDWFQTAIQSGAFEEQGMDSDHESFYSGNISETTPGPLSNHGFPKPDHIPERPLISHVNAQDQASDVPETSETDIDHRQRVRMFQNEALGDSTQASTALVPTRNTVNTNTPISGRIPRNVRPPRIKSLMARVLGYDAAFSEACKNGDLETAKKLLTKGLDLDSTRHERTAMGFAAARGDLTMATWLLDSGADIDLLDRNLMSPLTLSIKKLDSDQNIPMTEMLLRRGAKVNGGLMFGIMNPLYKAAYVGNAKLVALLLQYGAKVERSEFFSPLRKAVEGGYEDIFRIILEHISNSGKDLQGGEDFQATFEDCVAYGSNRFLKILLDYGANLNFTTKMGQSGFEAAIAAGKYDSARILLERGAEVNWRADFWAITKFLTDDGTSSECIQLVGKRLDLSSIIANGRTPLDWAMENQHFEIAQRFLDLGAKSNVGFWRRYYASEGPERLGNTRSMARNVVAGYEMFDSMQRT